MSRLRGFRKSQVKRLDFFLSTKHCRTKLIQINTPSFFHVIINNCKLLIDESCTLITGLLKHIVPIGLIMRYKICYILYKIFTGFTHGIRRDKSRLPSLLSCTIGCTTSLRVRVYIPVTTNIAVLRNTVKSNIIVFALMQNMCKLMVHCLEIIFIEHRNIDTTQIDIIHIIKRNFYASFCRSKHHCTCFIICRRTY